MKQVETNINFGGFYHSIHDGNIEILEINSKLYSNIMADYNQKAGEWLDSQK